MNFIKKNRRTILTIILFFALFIIGQKIYELLKYGLDHTINIYIQLSGLISSSLLALGCYWELYIGKNKKE